MSVDADVVTRCIRCIQALQEADKAQAVLQERNCQLQDVVSTYEHAVVATVTECADSWDYTKDSWNAAHELGGGGSNGSAAGTIVVVGGVRYVLEARAYYYCLFKGLCRICP